MKIVAPAKPGNDRTTNKIDEPSIYFCLDEKARADA
jgi:hypothetical protein